MIRWIALALKCLGMSISLGISLVKSKYILIYMQIMANFSMFLRSVASLAALDSFILMDDETSPMPFFRQCYCI